MLTKVRLQHHIHLVSSKISMVLHQQINQDNEDEEAKNVTFVPEQPHLVDQSAIAHIQ